MKAYDPSEFRRHLTFILSEGARPVFECMNCGHTVAVTISSEVSIGLTYNLYIKPCTKCNRLNKELDYIYAEPKLALDFSKYTR
jgi:hypothetical protein